MLFFTAFKPRGRVYKMAEAFSSSEDIDIDTRSSCSDYEEPQHPIQAIVDQYRPSDDVVKLCVLRSGKKYDYTIPSFSVITVKLIHVVVQTIEDEPETLDVFFKEDDMLCIPSPLPRKLIVQEACIINVSHLLFV